MAIPETRNGQKPFITGGLLKGQYVAEGVHFHWGSPNTRGAEHLINNKRYDIEMHIVHRNIRYNDVSEALNHPDGIAVLGVMLKIVNVSSLVLFISNQSYNRRISLGSGSHLSRPKKDLH